MEADPCVFSRWVLLVSLFVSPGLAEKRVTLVIGNSAYQSVFRPGESEKRCDIGGGNPKSIGFCLDVLQSFNQVGLIVSPSVSVEPRLTAFTQMGRAFKSVVHVRAKERTAAFGVL